ncbi:MAG: MFS transporter [Romboutsia sp.]|uniref:MFS transporter n=1 Tax=Romboutsia sp. TaxID=1965302 RepID=UPI003F2A04F9
MNNKTKFSGWNIAFAGFILMSTMYTIAINCTGLFVKPISEALNVSRSQVSLIPTIMTLAFAVLSPFVGKLINKYGIKVVMMIGALLVSLGMIGYSVSRSIYLIYLLSVIMGIGLSFCTLIPINILINNWFIEKKGLVTGIVFAGSGVGGFVFTQIITYILNTSTWDRAYLILGISSLILTLPIILILVKQSPEHVGQKPFGYKKSTKSSAEQNGFMLSEIKNTSTFKTVAISCFLINLISMGIISHFPSHLSDIGYSSSFVASVNSIYLLVVIGAKILLGVVFDKFGGKKGFLSVTLSFVFGFITMIFAKYQVVALSFGVFFAIAGSAGTVAIAFLVSDIFGKKDYAAIFGILTLIGTLGGALGSPISGIIYDNFGGYNVAWILYILLALSIYIFVCKSYKTIKSEKQYSGSLSK